MKTLGGKLLRSSGAATFSQVWRIGVTLITHALLRRLVPESDWGAWQWAVDFLFVILAQVRDVGLPAQLVRDEERPYGSFLRVEVIWGGALAVILFFAAPWLAKTGPDGSPNLVPVLWGLLIFFVIEGLGKVPLTFFEAEIRIDRVLVPELVRNLFFAVTAVGLAWIWGLGIYSMLIAHVGAAAVFTGMLWQRALKDGMPMTRAQGGAWRLVRRSLHLMPLAIVILAIDVVDLQLMASSFKSAEVGIYGAALTLALLTTRALEYPLRRALYPAFVAVRETPERYFEVYRLATIFLMSVHGIAAGLLYINAQLVLTIYGSGRYIAAVPYLELLCLVPLVQPFARCAEDVLLPRHEEYLLTASYVLNLISLCFFGLFLIDAVGSRGMALAKLLPLGSLVLAWAVHRIAPRGFWRLSADLVVVYGIGVALFGSALYLAGDLVWLRLVLSGLAAGLALLAYWHLYGDKVQDLLQRQLAKI